MTPFAFGSLRASLAMTPFAFGSLRASLAMTPFAFGSLRRKVDSRWIKAGVLLAFAALTPTAVDAFCGFYVAQQDTNLFNSASKVVLARDGEHTTLTMSNDYKGEPSEFAIVIPVPTVISKDMIKISDTALIDRIDQYTVPRLVEYYDPDPCPEPMPEYSRADSPYPMPAPPTSAAMSPRPSSRSLGVTVEAKYDVGEYDILILSAKDSSGLQTWLQQEGYHIPTGATEVLGSYIKQNMHFFVAKVDLGEMKALEQPFLRPLQVSYDSPKFMLPIRLGMVNADGPQDLLIYALTAGGRVETTNYRTTKIPTDDNVPVYVQAQFKPFYKALFERQVQKQGMQTVFLEYAWPLSIQCDPCSAEQLSAAELQSFGATWSSDYHGGVNGGFVTRLHVRYDMAHFPEDLVFQETADQSTFQGRYVVNHPFEGDTSCSDGRQYERTLATRQTQEVDNLAALTGWTPSEIWKNVPKRPNPATPPAPPKQPSWWEQQ
jgi:hypothetical protein